MGKNRKTTYEWTIEWVEVGSGDVYECDFSDKLSDFDQHLMGRLIGFLRDKEPTQIDIGVSRCVWDGHGDMLSRQYAYFATIHPNKSIEYLYTTHFSEAGHDGAGDGARVPARFIAEFKRWQSKWRSRHNLK